MTKAKLFRVDELVAKDFEVLYKILGVSERQAGELALREWIRKNRNQVSLETWTETRGAIAPVNSAMIKIRLTIVKAELQEILDTYKAICPEYRIETLHRPEKLIPQVTLALCQASDSSQADLCPVCLAEHD